MTPANQPSQAPSEQSLPIEAATLDGTEGIKEAKTGNELNQGAENLVQKFLAGALKEIDGLTAKSGSAEKIAANLSKQAKGVDNAATAAAKAANEEADTVAEAATDFTFAGMMPDPGKTETAPRMKEEKSVATEKIGATAQVASKKEDNSKKEDAVKLEKEDKPKDART